MIDIKMRNVYLSVSDHEIYTYILANKVQTIHCALADPVRVSSVSSVVITRPLRAHAVRSRVPVVYYYVLFLIFLNYLEYLHSSGENRTVT